MCSHLSCTHSGHQNRATHNHCQNHPDPHKSLHDRSFQLCICGIKSKLNFCCVPRLVSSSRACARAPTHAQGLFARPRTYSSYIPNSHNVFYGRYIELLGRTHCFWAPNHIPQSIQLARELIARRQNYISSSNEGGTFSVAHEIRLMFTPWNACDGHNPRSLATPL